MWATFGYTGLSSSLLALARYQANNLELSNQYEVFDAGGRVIGYFDRFAFSAEFVGRFVLNPPAGEYKEISWRLAGSVDCHVGKGVWLNTTFGRDFDDSTRGSLIALLNLKADVGERSIERPTLEPTKR